jgi:hypothetical protein
VFSLFALSLLTANLWRTTSADANLGIAFAVSVGALTLYFAAKYFICLTIQIVAQQRQFLYNVLCANVFTFFAMCFLLIPLFFAQTLVTAPYVEPLTQAQAWVAGAFFFFYCIKTLTIFLYERIPFFFWLLYFCTIELLPLAVMYKFVMNS